MLSKLKFMYCSYVDHRRFHHINCMSRNESDLEDLGRSSYTAYNKISNFVYNF